MDSITTAQGDTFYSFGLLAGNYINRACIYTIWTGNGIANQYNLLYVGETGDAGTRLDKTHHKYQSWIDHAINGLYVAFWWLPSAQFNELQRYAIEAKLIRRYNPACNN